MPELATSLGSFFSGPAGGLLQAGTAGVGTVGNILNMIQRGQQYSKVNANENLTPQQLAAKVSAATQPLNAGLVQAVTNQVQGADAERGLATSPGIFNSDLSQALAPYQQQNQNTALSLISQQLGLPTQAAGILNPTTNLSSSWANALKLLQSQPASPQTSSPLALQNLIWGNGGTPSSDSGLVDSPIDFGATAGANA